MDQDLANDFDTLVSIVSKNLSSHTPAAASTHDLRPAAVSIVLFHTDHTSQYCLIKRAKKGRNKGQWALPGGKVETDETEPEAAIREAQEEISLPAARSTVLGRLDDVTTKSGFVIAPFVVAAPKGWRPVAAAKEVARVFPFRVDRLLAPETPRWVRVDEGPQLLQMHIADGVHVHAPTGAVLWQFSQRALQGNEVSVTDVRQPEFTWR